MKRHPVYVLCGPTATGKTEIAHQIARQMQWPILSADAMQVYQGMTIGTAKPTPTEREGLVYEGLDWVTPDQEFSVGAYRQAAVQFVATVPPEVPVLMVGGTGLYINALLAGLDEMPPIDPVVRAEVQVLYAERGLSGLQEACRSLSPDRYARITDPANPRRVMRALELARMGVEPQARWGESPIVGAVAVLEWEREPLHERIEKRVDRMFAAGFLEEVRALRERWPIWSRTAQRAIGYQEASAVLTGELDVAAASALICVRTRQYARRQRTWFRRQLPARHVPMTPQTTVEEAVERVREAWEQGGVCQMRMD